MAQAAPTPGGMTGRKPGGTTGRKPGGTGGFTSPSGLPDIFDARVHRVAKVAIPVVLGLVYGYWAAANRRGGGPITGWNILFGLVTALAFIVLCLAVARFAPLLKRELHSLVKSGFAGAALGFLYSQTGESVLRSAAIGVAVTAGVFLVFFYRYYTREDGAGNRIR